MSSGNYTPEPWETRKIPNGMPAATIRSCWSISVPNSGASIMWATNSPASVAALDRAVECVNALAGVNDPVKALAAAREFLRDYLFRSDHLGINSAAQREARAALDGLGGVDE